VNTIFKDKENRDLAWMLVLSLGSILLGTISFILKMIFPYEWLELVSSIIMAATNVLIIFFIAKYWVKFNRRSREREKEYEGNSDSVKLIVEITGDPEDKWRKIMIPERKRRRQMATIFVLTILANVFSIYSNLYL
jgi:hypothetical protein